MHMPTPKQQCQTNYRKQAKKCWNELTVNAERKISPILDWRSTLKLIFFPSWKSRDTKIETDIKNLVRTKFRYCSIDPLSVVICQLPLKMVEEIGFENGRISNYEDLMTLTLTLDRVIRHTIVHQSSTSTYIPNFSVIGKTFWGQMDRRIDAEITEKCYRCTVPWSRLQPHLRPT